MLNTRRSITIKVVAGYLIVAILAALAVWFIYNQVVSYSKIAQSNSENNQQLILVSEITTDLNQSENTSRRLIQTGNEEELELYNSQIDSIKNKLGDLKRAYSNANLEIETDSMAKLMEQKKENLKELIELRNTDANTNYYSRVLRELKNIDASFSDYNYDNRFKDLKPYQRDILIKWLEYSKKDNSAQLTNQRLDSLVSAVKRVLTELEISNRQFRNEVFEKENALLDNDMILNQQLRSLLSGLERMERKNSLEKAKVLQGMLQKTSTIIIIGGCIIAIIILFFIINILRDITRSQRYRAELEESKQFAESLLASREQFMAAITHDLRSPLTTVMGYTDLIQKTGLNDKQSHYIQQVKKSSEFILRLVNDLLDLSKLEAGKMLIEDLPFNPKKLIEDTVHNVIPAEKKKEVKIRIEVTPETNVQVQSDPFRIKQILANLISNAWKFTEKGSIVISAAMEKDFSENDVLKIGVKDSGIGISAEMQESIFEEFSQENSSIEKRFGGSGLGLAITKRLTELLKGDIEVKSKQGEGSEFIIHIPVLKRSEAREETEKEEVPLPEKEYEQINKNALIVDDEAGQLSLTVEVTKSLGLKVETAINGKLALDKLVSGHYDIVLTDIQMPELDGFGLISAIRENNELQDLPVIALSGRKEVTKEVYEKAGFDMSLLKPYKPDELREGIATLLQIEHIPKEEEIPQNGHLKSEAYDLSDIYEFSGRDEEAMYKIIEAFLEGAGNSLRELIEAYKENNKDKLSKIAHRMLPMLRQMRADNLTNPLVKLENREQLSASEFEKFQENLRKLMQDLESDITV